MHLPIPITVLTGFLGSGKTTLLKTLLHHPEMAGAAIIVNEFGEVGIDDALIESATEETIMLPSGCICCAVRGDLVEALQRLYRQMQRDEIPAVSRVIVETSGLADPAPIAHTLMTEDDLFRIFQLDGIVATFDAELGPAQLASHFEPAKQISLADRIVLTKVDRVDEAQMTAAETAIRTLNRAAPIVRTIMGNAGPELIVGLAAFEPVAAKAHAETWLASEHHPAAQTPHTHECHDAHCDHPDHHHDRDPPEHTHTHGIQSFAVTFDEPLDGAKLSLTMELLRMTHGDKLLRIKGIMNIKNEPLPFVVHGVQHIFYPPTTLDAWPSDDRRSRLVFITKDLDRARVCEVLDGMFRPPERISEENWRAEEF